MKKIFVFAMTLIISTSASYALSFRKELRNAIKQDIKNTKADIKATNRSLKQAVKSDYTAAKNKYKADIENSKKAQAEAEAKQKKEAISKIDANISALNKEMTDVKNDKNISEVERVIRLRSLQNQTKYLYKQKAKLLK